MYVASKFYYQSFQRNRQKGDKSKDQATTLIPEQNPQKNQKKKHEEYHLNYPRPI